MPSIKSFAAKLYATRVYNKINRWASNPIETQERVFQSLISDASSTQFGRDHNFKNISTHEDFVKQVPVRDYEALRPYVEKVVAGESDILWKGRPLYFAKTSGTTSGAKYIPITKESMPGHIEAAKNAILLYIHQTGNTKIVNGKMIFLQGSPVLESKNGIQLGRLSGIVAHYVPKYLQKNRLPSWETNCIEDWETKVNTIVQETVNEDMSVIAGIPSWVQMYFEKLIEEKKQKVGELFKNFDLFIFGGVNYEPYRSKFESLIGRKIDSVELYPASEGFFAFQDRQNEPGMLLQLDSGMFYEFIVADTFFEASPTRLTLKDVKNNETFPVSTSVEGDMFTLTSELFTIDRSKWNVNYGSKSFFDDLGDKFINDDIELKVTVKAKKS